MNRKRGTYKHVYMCVCLGALPALQSSLLLYISHQRSCQTCWFSALLGVFSSFRSSLCAHFICPSLPARCWASRSGATRCVGLCIMLYVFLFERPRPPLGTGVACLMHQSQGIKQSWVGSPCRQLETHATPRHAASFLSFLLDCSTARLLDPSPLLSYFHWLTQQDGIHLNKKDTDRVLS